MQVFDQKRIEDFGIGVGKFRKGRRNAITDVEGVLVGHSTIDRDDVKTGVTAIFPHSDNLFREKVPAAVHVINGYGKTTGTIQIQELGTIETPILLTNTFAVGTCTDALVRYMLRENLDVGSSTLTVNPVVCECNDHYLNDMRGMHVREAHVAEALGNASSEFREGGVGAGTGMSCYKLKGGIGTASRIIEVEGFSFTLGMLVLTNMGNLGDLTIQGRRMGEEIKTKWAAGASSGYITAGLAENEANKEKEQGSIIMIVATDAPLSERQLGRIARRAETGVSRTGNAIANGSGEIVLAFSTANRVLHYEERVLVPTEILNEEMIDRFFRGVAECAEEAVLNSMVTAVRCDGRDGHVRESLAEYL